MAIDTSIYGLSGRGVKSVNDYDREYEALLGARQDRQMGALQLMLGQQKADEYTRGVERANQLRALSGTWKADTTDEQRVASLRNAGFANEADALEKGILERMKTRATVDKDTAEAASKRNADKIKAYEFHVQRLGQVSDPQMAEAWLTEGVKSGVMSMQEAQQGLKILQSRPDMFPEWKARTLQGGMSALQQMQEARAAAQAADTRANQKLIPDGKGGYIVNEPLIEANARIARAGASQNVTYGSPVAGVLPDGTQVLVQPGNRGGPVAPMRLPDGTMVQPPPPKDSTKPLPSKVVTELKDARENAAAMDALASTFKPEFAGKGVLGLGADMQVGASANLGVDKGTVDWWKNYRKQAELVERHAMFGASLTQGEQAAWRSADISPGMDPKVVQKNLATRQRLAKRVLENTVADMSDAGYDPKRVQAIGGRQGSASALAGDAPVGIPPMDAIEAELRRRQGGK